MFYFLATITCYLGVLFSPFANAASCTAYDEELVGDKCMISMNEITYCPGEIQPATCFEQDGTLSNNMVNCSGHVEYVCITNAN